MIKTQYGPTLDFIWDLIRSQGLDPRPLFAQAGIDPAVRRDPDTRVPLKNVDKLNEIVYETTGDVALGVRATEQLHPSHLGPLGYAWLTSPTLGAGLDKLRRYISMCNPVINIEVFHEGGYTLIRSSRRSDPENSALTDFARVAVVMRMIRLLVGMNYNPVRVDFLPEQPSDLQPFKERFRCPMEFGCDVSQIVVDQSQLSAELPTSHPALARMHDELLLKFFASLKKDDIVSNVRTTLVDLMPEGKASADEVAGRLNMSVRTLRRRLDEHDQNFRQVLSDLREEMAMKFIEDHSVTLTEISWSLGFSEQSSFSRAFRGWTGQSPREARA